MNNTMDNITDKELMEHQGDDHFWTGSTATPMRPDAFDLSDQEKISQISDKFSDIMNILGLDMSDDSLKGTPHRVAKMYVKELFRGLNPDNKPKASTFDNKYQYGDMLVEKNIVLYSTCEHHFLPIVGKAHVAYFSKGKVIGLSKLNRIVQYYAERPTVQERLTMQIVEDLKKTMGTEDVACIIDAKHLCVNSRGIKDINSSTVTAEYSGKFKSQEHKRALLDYINMDIK